MLDIVLILSQIIPRYTSPGSYMYDTSRCQVIFREIYNMDIAKLRNQFYRIVINLPVWGAL